MRTRKGNKNGLTETHKIDSLTSTTSNVIVSFPAIVAAISKK